MGDDWDYPDVCRAAKEVARITHKPIHAEEKKCWTIAETDTDTLVLQRGKYYDQAADLRPEWKRAFSDVRARLLCEIMCSSAVHSARIRQRNHRSKYAREEP